MSSLNISTLTPQATASISSFNTRAAQYDAANGGWHITLGTDYVSWLSSLFPDSGSGLHGIKLLDLACGTGLVTFPAAQAVGPKGRVMGIDISPGMLDVARSKLAAMETAETARVELLEGDITELSGLNDVMDVVRDEGGWDAITVCSAVPLIGDVEGALKHWKNLLKPEGLLMFDVPTEDRTVQHLMTIDVPERMGKSLTFDRRWVRDLASVEDVVCRAGLKIVKAWRTRSYVPEKVWNGDQADEAWEEHVLKHGAAYAKMVEGLDSERARLVWKECFKENLGPDGTFVDGHWLYGIVAIRG